MPRNSKVTISGQRTEEWNVSVTYTCRASSGPFQLIQQSRMNICANYTFQYKEPNSEKKNISYHLWQLCTLQNIIINGLFIHREEPLQLLCKRPAPRWVWWAWSKTHWGQGRNLHWLQLSGSSILHKCFTFKNKELCDQVGMRVVELHVKTVTEV